MGLLFKPLHRLSCPPNGWKCYLMGPTACWCCHLIPVLSSRLWHAVAQRQALRSLHSYLIMNQSCLAQYCLAVYTVHVRNLALTSVSLHSLSPIGPSPSHKKGSSSSSSSQGRIPHAAVGVAVVQYC